MSLSLCKILKQHAYETEVRNTYIVTEYTLIQEQQLLRCLLEFGLTIFFSVCQVPWVCGIFHTEYRVHSSYVYVHDMFCYTNKCTANNFLSNQKLLNYI